MATECDFAVADPGFLRLGVNLKGGGNQPILLLVIPKTARNWKKKTYGPKGEAHVLSAPSFDPPMLCFGLQIQWYQNALEIISPNSTNICKAIEFQMYLTHFVVPNTVGLISILSI